MTGVSVVSWARAERRLTSDEVDSAFAAAWDRLQVFAFETRRLVVEPHTGSFSLKLVLRGRERYVVDGLAVDLEPGSLLLVNDGERYSSGVDGPLTTAVSCFLPAEQARSLPEVVPIPFRPSPLLAGLVAGFASACRPGRRGDPAGVDDVVQELVTAAVPECLARLRPQALSRVVHRRTRRDLLARALRARDYIEDEHGVGITLDQLADVACLSKYHLLRVFAAAFGATPAVYAQRCRLRRARALVDRGLDLRSVARRTGYGSVSTLGRALRAQGRGGSSDTGASGSRRSRTSV